MIVYSKINAIYSKDEIYKIFPRITARKIIFNRDVIKINVLAKYCDFKKIKYTMEDLKKDYPKLAEYKSLDIAYKIYASGYSVKEFYEKFEIGSYLEYIIRNGINFNSVFENGYKIIEFMEWKIDTKKFKIDKYDTHIELFGKAEQLKAFKEKYGIRYEVIYEPYKKSWHLAFNGILADYIRIHK